MRWIYSIVTVLLDVSFAAQFYHMAFDEPFYKLLLAVHKSPL